MAARFLVFPLLDQVPEWAGLPLLIVLTAVTCYVMVWVVRWRRSRTDGSRVLANASVPLDQPTGYSKHVASPDGRFVAVTTTHNVSMEVWIDDLLLCDVQRNRWMLHLPNPYRVKDLAWAAGSRLRLSVNRFPDGGTWIDLVLDPDARTAEVGGMREQASVRFARLVAWLNRFYDGPINRFFTGNGPGTLALPGARSSRTFTFSMVLLVLTPVVAMFLGAQRDARDDVAIDAPTPPVSTEPVATVTTSTGPAPGMAPAKPVALPAPPGKGSAAVRVGGPIKSPTKVRDVRPVYPPAAIQARVQGIVILEVTIAPHGSVSDARVLRSIPMLDAAALDAARQWMFTPTLVDGLPVSVIHTVTVPFTLR